MASPVQTNKTLSNDAHPVRLQPGQRLARGVSRHLRALGFAALEEFVPVRGLRVDVLGLGPKGELWVIECKSSRADFQSDTKWQGYLEWCDRYFWAVDVDFPTELLPPDTGLIIADAYDAITSTRVYSPAKTALEGLQILTAAKKSHFDPELVDHFIEAIGIYPAGSVAELSTGEAAIVLATPREHQRTPLVLVVRDHNKQPCEERKLDLSQQPLDSSGKVIKIRHLYSNSAFGIDLKQYYGLLR